MVILALNVPSSGTATQNLNVLGVSHLPPIFPRKEISIASLLAETSRTKPDTFYPRIPTLQSNKGPGVGDLIVRSVSGGARQEAQALGRAGRPSGPSSRGRPQDW